MLLWSPGLPRSYTGQGLAGWGRRLLQQVSPGATAVQYAQSKGGCEDLWGTQMCHTAWHTAGQGPWLPVPTRVLLCNSEPAVTLSASVYPAAQRWPVGQSSRALLAEGCLECHVTQSSGSTQWVTQVHRRGQGSGPGVYVKCPSQVSGGDPINASTLGAGAGRSQYQAHQLRDLGDSVSK